MKKFTLLFMLLCSMVNYAQDWHTIAKQDLENQKTIFEAKEIEYDALEIQRKATSVTNTAVYDTVVKHLRKVVPVMDSLYYVREKSVNFYAAKTVLKDSLVKFFPKPKYAPLTAEDTPVVQEQKKISIIYGNGKVIEESELSKNKKLSSIFEELFSEKSEAYLGDFEIPAHRQKIQLYKKVGQKPIEEYLYFENVRVSIREGGMYDIRLCVSNESDTQKYYFINRVPISLLRYMKVAEDSYLLMMINNSNDKDKSTTFYKSTEARLIRLSDVLRYFNNTGNNFVPDDEDYCFPPKEDTENANANALRLYKIRQDTNLQNIMELRTYTDFLGLFDEDSPNGLVQIEGKADFYLAPFQVNRSFPLTVFKKVTPYVNFARIDDELRGINLVPTVADATVFKFERPLEMIEKAYLDMGVITDIVGGSFTKEFPFSINVYVPVRYKVSTIKWADESEDNFKTIGTGVGIRIEAKRFNNFGFTHSTEWTNFNHVSRIENLQTPRNFWVFRNESEIFYYPNKTKKQSIFLRLRSYLDRRDGEDSFFQLQFGYRFAIGLSKKAS